MALRNNLGLWVNGRLKIHWISKSSIWWVPNFRLKYSSPSNTWVETRVQLRTNTWSAGLYTGRTNMVIVNQPFYNSNHVTDVSSSSDAKKAVEFTSAAVCSNFFGCPFCRCPWSSLFFSLGFWEASSLPTGLPLLDLCSLKIGFEVRPSAPPTSSAAGDIEIACANPWPASYHHWPCCYGHRTTFPSLLLVCLRLCSCLAERQGGITLGNRGRQGGQSFRMQLCGGNRWDF